MPLATGNTWEMRNVVSGVPHSTTTTLAGDTLDHWPNWSGPAFPLEVTWDQGGRTGSEDWSFVYGNLGQGLSFLGGVAPEDTIAVRWDTWRHPTQVGAQSQLRYVSYSNSGTWSPVKGSPAS